MSGSGGCVFAEVADAETGRTILADCPREWRGFVARGVARSALLARLRDGGE
jgi:4-diphosphocytidyl-2C-methyl-D-erythritol kinase